MSDQVNSAAFARQVPYLLMGDRQEETVETHEGRTIYRALTVPRKDGSDLHQWAADGIEIKSFLFTLSVQDGEVTVDFMFEFDPAIEGKENAQ